MCRTVHSILQTIICGIQMLVRVVMTVLLMLENLIRMILQTLYNFVSFMLQLISLAPLCVVFIVFTRLKCFMMGGGGGCPANRGGACDCLMSLLAVILLFFIFRATGIMDKIFYSLGYAKARAEVVEYVPTPGDITQCSRNESEYVEYLASTEEMTEMTKTTETTETIEDYTVLFTLVTRYEEMLRNFTFTYALDIDEETTKPNTTSVELTESTTK